MFGDRKGLDCRLSSIKSIPCWHQFFALSCFPRFAMVASSSSTILGSQSQNILRFTETWQPFRKITNNSQVSLNTNHQISSKFLDLKHKSSNVIKFPWGNPWVISCFCRRFIDSYKSIFRRAVQQGRLLRVSHLENTAECPWNQ